MEWPPQTPRASSILSKPAQAYELTTYSVASPEPEITVPKLKEHYKTLWYVDTYTDTSSKCKAFKKKSAEIFHLCLIYFLPFSYAMP